MSDVALFDGASVEGLGDLLHPPVRLCMDRSLAHGPVRAPRTGLTLQLTTRAAARLNVSGAFVTALAMRQPWIEARFHEVDTAVQEALANAVMHGNLQLDSNLRSDLAGLTEFARLMEDRLADPAYGLLAVTLSARWTSESLFVAVRNENNGFSPPYQGTNQFSPSRYGQGLTIIRSVSSAIRFADHGRCIAMRFAA